MKVIVATQNQDKFKIIQSLLSETGLNEAEYLSLKDLNIESQAEETGSLINRAEQKALFAAKTLIMNNISFDLIVGADDGMKLVGKDTDENSKEITENILNNNLLKVGENLIIVRAFAFVNSKGEVAQSFETEIPFKFIGNSKGITSQEFKYPLSYVLAPINKELSVKEMSDKDSLNYYLEYCRKSLEENVTTYLKALNETI